MEWKDSIVFETIKPPINRFTPEAFVGVNTADEVNTVILVWFTVYLPKLFSKDPNVVDVY